VKDEKTFTPFVYFVSFVFKFLRGSEL